MNYEVFINGETTGRVVVNSPSKEQALSAWDYWHPDKIEIELKPCHIHVPKMFQNCIMDVADFELLNSEN